MSEQKEKEKSKFTLPSSLRNMQEQYRNEPQPFSRDTKQHQKHAHSKKEEKNRKSLFKLNPASAAPVSQPIETLRKRSKSQKLESLHAEPPKEGFSLMDNYKQAQDKRLTDRKPILKNYDIDIRQMITGQNKQAAEEMQQEEEPEKYEIVKPSQPYVLQKPKQTESIFEPTIFQTPILPCFASEFTKRTEITKTVQEGEGLWKIGRIKVKKGKMCELKIGEFVFEGEKVRGEGRAGLLAEGNLHSLPNWKDMWILQPHESLFTD